VSATSARCLLLAFGYGKFPLWFLQKPLAGRSSSLVAHWKVDDTGL
jgi:hypothetical protein